MVKKEKSLTLEEMLDSIPNYLDDIEVTKTGLLCLDSILSGGYKSGNLYQIASESNINLSKIMLQIASKFCVQSKKVVFIDAEGNITPNMLNDFKLNEQLNKNFFYIREASFKEVELILDKFLATTQISLIIVHTIAGMLNSGYLNLQDESKKAKKEKGISITNNNSNFGSRPLGLFVQKYKTLAYKNKTVLLFSNQFRSKVDPVLGTQKKIYGGFNLIYNSNSILVVKQIIKSGKNKNFKSMFETMDGECLEFEVVRDDKLKPKVKVPFFYNYDGAISQLHSWVFGLIEKNVIEVNSDYYTLGDIKAHGIAKICEELLKNNTFIYTKYKDVLNEFYEKFVNDMKC